MAQENSREPYSGATRKLVVAFDVGTTFSGASYSVLDPGVSPTIHGITRFPGHATVNSASKIPTILYYDANGGVAAVGAEALRDGIEVEAEENGWFKAEWFKLHLRSRFGEGKDLGNQLPPLPLEKTVVDVLSDFLTYLMQCTSAYIQDSHPAGFWESVKDNVEFVLSHPNGWEGSEQAQMRKAAVKSKLISDTVAGHERLSFVSEGESSLHFAIEHKILTSALKEGDGVIVVDAGGGTVDISTYRKKMVNGATGFEEVSPPQCFFHGSVFVSLRAKDYLQSYLSKSKYLDDLDYIIRCFDENTKIRFKSDKDPQYVKFATTRDNDPACNIRFGQLRLEGTDVANLFDPSIKCIVDAVASQKQTLKTINITHVVLVGGFSGSHWMFNEVRRLLEPEKVHVFRAEHHANKAVSDGSVSFYLDHFVRYRVAKVTYGSRGRRRYDPTDPDYTKRTNRLFVDPNGAKWITHGFDSILLRGTQVSEEKEFRRTYFNFVKDLKDLKTFSTSVFCYRGINPDPIWMDDDPDQYSTLCSITGDLSKVGYTTGVGTDGQPFYRFGFDLVLLFGLTELKALLAWEEGGVEKRCPATIVYY